MERSPYDMSALFAQLSVASDEQSIDRSMSGHAPLANDAPWREAALWTAAQAGFRREASLDDVVCVTIVDALNSELRVRSWKRIPPKTKLLERGVGVAPVALTIHLAKKGMRAAFVSPEPTVPPKPSFPSLGDRRFRCRSYGRNSPTLRRPKP